MRTRVTFAVLLVAAAACGDDGESSGGKSEVVEGANATADPKPTVYPETTEGLEQLIEEITSAIREKKPALVDELTSSLELNGHKAWFVSTFGEDNGAKLASDYAPYVSRLVQMSSLFAELLSNQQTRVAVERFDRADDPASIGYQSLALAAMKKPTPLYSVRLFAPGKEHGFHLWSFAYQGGNFRWVGKMRPLYEKSPSAPDDLDRMELRLRDANSLPP